ncbi:MAG TPA: hypothetical protein VGW80_08910 [Solirubrobacterales bacterium]|nr:hypothetical protein [Solirubrobacterales bacterium]
MIAAVALCVTAAQITISGCGNTGSGAPSAQQLESAHKEGEEAARETARIERLQHQVNHLQKEVHRRARPTAVVTNAGSPRADAPVSTYQGAARTFHAPSGNVSCEVFPHGALCSVASLDETFTFMNGEEAHVEAGAALPEGAGELAPYGETISTGSVTCSIPQASEPRGITCSDSGSGHGFEASRVPERQSTY